MPAGHICLYEEPEYGMTGFRSGQYDIMGTRGRTPRSSTRVEREVAPAVPVFFSFLRNDSLFL